MELRDAGHNGLQVVGAGPETKPWVALFQAASSRHSHHKAGVHLYDVRNGGRLLVRDIWYEGNAWSMVELKDRGEFACRTHFQVDERTAHFHLEALVPLYRATGDPAVYRTARKWYEWIARNLWPVPGGSATSISSSARKTLPGWLGRGLGSGRGPEA